MKLKKLLNTNYNQIFQIRLLKNGTPTFCDYFNKYNYGMMNVATTAENSVFSKGRV